ncbi:MAG: hypothetical protein AAB573_02400 [Patescibacteria group bacterium]
MAEKQSAYSRADFFDHLANNPGSRYNDLLKSGGRDVAYDAYLKAARAVEPVVEQPVHVEPERASVQ